MLGVNRTGRFGICNPSFCMGFFPPVNIIPIRAGLGSIFNISSPIKSMGPLKLKLLA